MNERRDESHLDEVDALLSGETDLTWTPHLTTAVMARVRRERLRNLVWGVAAAALLLACAWIGGNLLLGIPAIAETADSLSATIPLPGSPGEVLGDVRTSLVSISETLTASIEGPSALTGLPLALGALVMLLTLNGIAISRPLLARRRNS